MVVAEAQVASLHSVGVAKAHQQFESQTLIVQDTKFAKR